ncbi:hypothetical protein FA13DRAFT_1399158 [Coprinellus micaceus]|uniref:C2H2-type domain-containing protein n=1 Tax=Coprinellus micaceus TaxID=71717 RepID=A0A4Y7SPT2_COPMI|nr:hypothetical protein FA13DRAFT_1399158 [Coprinellus micaceus]
MDPYGNAPQMQPSTSYGQQFLSASNPSSTHSSPRSFTHELDPSASYPSNPASHLHHSLHSQSYPIPGGPAYPSGSVHPHRRSQQFMPNMMSQRSASYSSTYSTGAPPLQVSTNTSSEHDPNERTARPGNAHNHLAFHTSLSLPLPPMPDLSNSLVTPTATTAGSSTLSSMPSAGLSSAGNAQQDAANAESEAHDYIAGTPGLSKGLSRPLTQVEKERLAWLYRLKYFLATAPSRWHTTDTDNNNMGGPSSGFGQGVNMYPGMGMDGSYPAQHAPSHPQLNRFMLPSQEFVTCVLWNGLYHITGTDIVRALVFRFEAFGRPVRNMKKFEEGVFSDLRNLKPGVDACLEEPKYQCIRTQKKQKVFYWFSVPHDRLFLDALDRDLKREKMGQEATTVVIGEPAMSFTYDPKRPLYEQFSKAVGARDGEGEFERNVRNAVKDSVGAGDSGNGTESDLSDMEDVMGTDDEGRPRTSASMADALFVSPFGLGDWSHYKQRRKKAPNAQKQGSTDEAGEERGRSMGPDSSGRYPSVSHSRERPSRLMPRYESIRHEFGPGSEDERQQSEAALTAADYFRRQAEGKLLPADGVVRKPKDTQFIGEVDVHYTDGAPPVPPPLASAPSTHVFGLDQPPLGGRAGHLRGRSIDQATASSHPHRHSYHGPPVSYGDPFDFPSVGPFGQVPMSAGIAPSISASSSQGSQPPKPTPPAPAPVSSTAMYEQHGADGKIKAFVCPLFSCGRLFKRMEHLKRHLRTHTMERPFTCPKCKKRFSRSDNLNQHLRTHERTNTGPAGASPNAGENGNGENAGASDNGNAEWSDSMDDEREGSSGHHGDQSGGESEDEDWARYTSLGDMNNQALGLSGMDLSALGMAGGYAGDVQMRELEASDVQEVQGDEEGLLMVANHSTNYYPLQSSSALFSANSTDFGSDGSQWTRPQPSPAFSTISMPSPNLGNINLRSNRNSIGSSPGNYLQQLQGHSANPSMSSSYGEDFGAVSAPSHKASFDHGNLYTSNMVLDDSSTGVGPIRRHRSMTPSHARNGEPIRRPGTANSNNGDFNSLGSTPASVGSASSTSSHRGYHPYAAGFNSSSRSNSAHSSPNLHNIQLANAGEYGHIRSSSRSSNYAPAAGVMQVQEQMKQMMSMGGDVSMAGQEATSAFGEPMFRTDSPAFVGQTESPAPFNIDLPNQFAYGQGIAQPGHSATLPVQFSQQQQQQQQFGDGHYPQHLPTM